MFFNIVLYCYSIIIKFISDILYYNYSILDFDNGYALYELGKQSNKCIQYELC